MASRSQKSYLGLHLALTGARCQKPDCGHPLTRTVNGKPVPEAEIAHIRARRPGGKRHDPSWSHEQLDGVENLLLLCPAHHKVIDGTEADDYTVAELESWQQHHRPQGPGPESDEAAALAPAPWAVPLWRSWPTVAELDAPGAGVRPSWPYDGATVPAYVPRDHDAQLAESLARAGVQGGLVLVAGDTACGKSRLLFEAARRVLPDHLVCRVPVGGLRAAVAAVLHCPRPCLLWLDDLGPDDRLQGLDVAELRRSRVPVLATVHTRHFPRPTAPPPRLPADDRPAAVISPAVLDQALTVFLERAWSRAELQRARTVEDPRIRLAVEQCTHLGVSEYLAAGPALWRTWQAAWRIGGNPRGAALVRGAVDLARTGLRGPFSPDLLERAHRYYLVDAGGELLQPEPLHEAFAWAETSRIGMTGLLQPASDGARRPFAALLGDSPPHSPGPVHPLLWFEALEDALANARDVETAWEVAITAEREHPSVAPWLWRSLREVGVGAALRREALTWLRLGRCEEALTLLREHADPADPLAHRITGLVLRELGRYDEAEAACRAAYAAGDADGLADLAQLLAERGRPDEAEDAYRRAARAGARNAWFNLGVLLADRGKSESAVRAYRQAVAAGDLDALTNLGQLLAETGRTREAEQVLRRAVEHGDREAQLDLANLLKRLHRTDEAERLYEQLIELGDARAWINLGNLHDVGERPDRAEHAYRQALAAGLTVAHAYLGRHLVRRKRWQEAVPHLRQAVALDPEQSGPMRPEDGIPFLGTALKELGETEEAKDVFRAAALAGEPLAAVGFFTVSDESEAEERRALLRRAVDRDDPDAMLVLLVDYESTGHPRRAKALRRRLVDCGDAVTTVLLAAYDRSSASVAG
ncbi:tetratricopeptide repeat protein [Kitasatospora sp. NPDC059088]|uniref:tetratricopeptide repeat protein n=1 Tax=Kitasatospora sp. NPDC059088 TaxID=3346722 RepID=UPI0036935A76